MNPRQGVPSESPISPLAVANPSSKGRRSLQACSHRNSPPRAVRSITGCHRRTGRGQCRGTRWAQLHGLGPAVVRVVEEEACSWTWSVAPSRSAASPWQKCSASWTQLRTDRPMLQAGRLSGQKAFYPSKYALNGTKLARPYNYPVGELY